MMLHLSNTMQGKVSCSQQSCCDSDSTELYGQIIFGDWFCVADTVSVGGFNHTYTSENKLIHSLADHER